MPARTPPTRAFKTHAKITNPNHIDLLDCVIGRRPNRYGTMYTAPQLVIGHILNSDESVAGFTTMPFEKDGSRAGILPLTTKDRQVVEANNIDTRLLYGIPLEDIDLRKGVVGTLNASVLPDIIAHRAVALFSQHYDRYNMEAFTNEDGEIFYDGIRMNGRLFDNNPDLESQPDVELNAPLLREKSDLPDADISITQSDIDAIAQWAIKSYQIALNNPDIEMDKYENGLWPLWADIPARDITELPLACCSVAHKKDRKNSRHLLSLASFR